MPIDYRHYPSDWKARRARILARAEHQCEHCGAPNYSIIRRIDGAPTVLRRCKNYQWARLWHRQLGGTLIVLTMAHKDHDEWNHSVPDDRLCILCQYCHFQYDRHDNAQRRR